MIIQGNMMTIPVIAKIKPVILFKLESGKHVYINNYEQSASLSGLHRVNDVIDINPSGYYGNSITVIDTDTICKLQKVSTRQECIGYTIGEKFYDLSAHDALINSLVLTWDTNDNPICASIDDYNEYKRIQSIEHREFQSITELTDVEFIISKLPTSSEFIIPMWHENLSKLDLYKLDSFGYALHVCKLCADKYGYSYVGEKGTRDKEWGYSTHSELRYLQINGDYCGDDSMRYGSYIGTINDINTRMNNIETKITDIFRKSNMKYVVISADSVTVRQLYDNAHNALVSLSKVDPKISSKSKYNETISYIKCILNTLDRMKQ